MAVSPEVVLRLQDVACGYAGRAVLSGVSLEVRAGEILALLGRNGAGKTTLFRTVLGLLPAVGGTVEVGGRPLDRLSRRERARQLGYVPQVGEEPFGHRVLDVVLLGRTASLGWRPVPGPRDVAVARESLDRLDIADLAERGLGELSGGQRQLVLVARALAQRPAVLMLDEPTANLDLGNEVRVLACLRDLAADGVAVVFTSHRPEHAFGVGSRALLLQPDGSYTVGPVRDVLTAVDLGRAYGVEVRITPTDGGHGPTLCAAVLPSPRT
ncbi:ABC transporter ATP-binding protein [Actinomycetospora sp. NBRC 106378]|uniref:ABC transporter ATP-binding protein n=1 Tax=Actinomycetospora sp. NBRC 106378 TaxID=3032208 RepID=UPI0024A12A0F|nr:ABC transporter ATP-binding protein [Actinomycetospora sp. NBRC 106378]GLZ54858.1 iron ABC transporter ATP-binding protein [Actinomycetospora sp. NBRC 106378]